ncbi:hypothetical protein A1L58_03525 [Shewanella baltica]|nr:hypothetical protein A1L58_03525 [Shewanella baltica]
MSKSLLGISFIQTDYTSAQKVSNGDLRDDRPPHGGGGRASKDGLASRRRVNAMASLYAWISANANPLKNKTKTKNAGPTALLSNRFQSPKYVAYIFSIHGSANAKKGELW